MKKKLFFLSVLLIIIYSYDYVWSEQQETKEENRQLTNQLIVLKQYNLELKNTVSDLKKTVTKLAEMTSQPNRISSKKNTNQMPPSEDSGNGIDSTPRTIREPNPNKYSNNPTRSNTKVMRNP